MYVLCRVCSIIHWILEQIPGLIDGAEEPLLASPNIKKIYEYTYKYKYILQIIYIIRCSVVWCPKNNQNLAKKTSLSRLEYGTRYIQYYGRARDLNQGKYCKIVNAASELRSQPIYCMTDKT